MKPFLLTGSYITHLPIKQMNDEAKKEIKQDEFERRAELKREAQRLRRVQKIKQSEEMESKIRFVQCNIIDTSSLQVNYG